MAIKSWIACVCCIISFTQLQAMEVAEGQKEKSRVTLSIAEQPQEKKEACWHCDTSPLGVNSIQIICTLCKNDKTRRDWPDLCIQGRFEEYKALLEKYPELLKVKHGGDTPLHEALLGYLRKRHNSTELIIFLLEKGAEQNFRTGTFVSVLNVSLNTYENKEGAARARLLIRALEGHKASVKGWEKIQTAWLENASERSEHAMGSQDNETKEVQKKKKKHGCCF